MHSQPKRVKKNYLGETLIFEIKQPEKSQITRTHRNS